MSWPTVEIKKVARVVGGATPKSGVAEYWDGEIAWATPKDLADLDGKEIADTPRKITDRGLRSCAAEQLPPGSVLFSSRAPIGHIAINSAPMATNQGFKSFIPGPNLDASFLYWWLDANRERLQAMGNGATFKEVSKAVVERIALPLPPLPEQRRIAAILDQADALRRLRRQSLSRLSDLGQSIFFEMFGDLRSNTRRWATEKLGNLCDLVRGSSPRPQGDPRYFGGPVPRLMIADITRDGRRVRPTIDSLTIEGAKRSRPMKSGDVVLAVSGAVGLPAILEIDACIHDGFVGFRELSAAILPDFLYHFLLVQRVANSAKGTGAIWKNLTTDQVRDFDIPCPPLSQQKQFIARLTEAEYKSDSFADHLLALDALFTSLQHRAFRGEL